MSKVIYKRSRHAVNVDPQRRCYNGCHAKSELRWSEWELLDWCQGGDSEKRLKFWIELNDYAVSQRGESARSEFEIREL